MARRGHNEGSLYRRKDGYWCASIRVPSGKRVVRYAQTKKEAARILGDLAGKQRMGRLAAPTSLTVEDWLTQWLADVRTRVRPTTYRRYESAARLYLRPSLGTVRLQRVTPTHISLVITGLSDRPAMARTVLEVARRALGAAVRFDLLATNPAERVDPPPAHRREPPIWTPEQFARFIRSVQEDRWGPLWLTLAGTGLRVGEALGLEWSDVSLDEETLRIRHALAWVGSTPVLGQPKTEAGRRTVTLAQFIVRALHRQRAWQAEDRLAAGLSWLSERDACFTESDGRTPGSGTLGKRFRRACVLADVPSLRIHDLRHVHASLAIADGADPKTVQARLGHASVHMTLGVYSHRVQGGDRRVAEAFDRIASGA